MATYTSNYGWTKPSGSDNVDISVLNNNLDDQDSTIHDAFLNMAPPFSESSTYAVDDIVLYGTGLYKCHTAVVTPGSWTGSTNWQVYKLSEGGSGGGGGTSNYPDLTNKPQINGVTLSGNKTTSALGIDKTAVGLGNVPNVSTNDQTPTFTEASTRNNIASGEKLSVIFGKIQKFFNDLKTVAFSGSYSDLSDKPTIPTSASGISYDNTDSGLSATDVQGAVDEVAQKMGNVRMLKRWENPNPSADFERQAVTLSSGNYDLLLVIAKYATTFGNNLSNVSSSSGYLTFPLAGSSGPANYTRSYSVNGNVVTFGDSEMSAHNSPSKVISNNTLIPYQIYSIELL